MLDDRQERLLADGLRKGQTHAWQTLYDAHAERLWRTVARLLGPPSADVADVVQETLLAAARSARSYDPERGSLWHWLSGIARNQAALHFRKKATHDKRAALGGQVLHWLEGKEPSPPSVLASAEVASHVRWALSELSDEHALLLTARYLDGDDVSLIAQRESASEVAVRSKLARARQAFREAFGKYAQEPSENRAEAHHGPP